jgi:D-alanyl-D-alanine carboxypeptidase
MVNHISEPTPKKETTGTTEQVDALIKFALLKALETKPIQQDSLNWFGIPKGLLVTGLGTLALALFNWFLSIQTEATKLSNDLIKLAVAVEDQDQAARNLRFLSRLKLISVGEIQLNEVLNDPESRPLFTSGDIGPTYRINADGTIEFEDNWATTNTISTTIPQLIGIKKFQSDQIFKGVIRLNRVAMPAAIAAFEEIEAVGLKDRILSFDGAFVPRTIRGTERLSAHALGLAFDINFRWNMLGKSAAEIGQEGSVKELVPIFEKHGFKWGGTFSRPDGSHFEYQPLQVKPAVQR